MKEENVPSRASEDCAMTSRTNSHMAEHNQQGETRPSPSALQQRRREVLERYLAGDPIAVICRELGCAKSWLYKWKKRYQATEPEWFQEHSRLLRAPRRKHLMPLKRKLFGCAIRWH
jgi:transposase-like protein